MRSRFSMLLAAFVGFGCSFDGANPFGDAGDPQSDASTDGAPQACTTFDESCGDADTLLSCQAGVFAPVPCAYGCFESSGTARCATLDDPSLGVEPVPPEEAKAALQVVTGEIWVVDTSTGRIRVCGGADVRASGDGVKDEVSFELVKQADEDLPELGVFAFRSLAIRENATIRVIGSRALAFVVSETVDIQGELRLGGGSRACSAQEACAVEPQVNRRCAGPGGYSGGAPKTDEDGDDGDGPGAGDGGTRNPDLGGGGGGFAAPGGSGGGAENSGAAVGAATVLPLQGGSGGGAGGSNSASGSAGRGGGGGGALYIWAAGRVWVRDTGGIAAGGAGGGASAGGNSMGGGGGGAGGSLFIEAPLITIEGRVSCNGGGGGAGLAETIEQGAGTAGTYGNAGANGGLGANPGGAGGGRTAPAGQDGSKTGGEDATGGGGGAAGRIRLRAFEGSVDIQDGAQVSPAPRVDEDLLEK